MNYSNNNNSHDHDNSSSGSGSPQRHEPLELKVFQASPLAYGNIPIPFIDLDEEEDLIRDAVVMQGSGSTSTNSSNANSNKVRVSFEIATAHGLSTFLAQGTPFLHLSCHGGPRQLFIEDGFGGCHILVVGEHLQSWITAGNHQLQFVFVSACHSRSAGEAFLHAGVPYVICCEQDGFQLLDQAARVFARHFYAALALPHTQVPLAFEIARSAVIQAPEMKRVAGIDPQVEARKFVLLQQQQQQQQQQPSQSQPPQQPQPSQPQQPQQETTPQEHAHTFRQQFMEKSLSMHNITPPKKSTLKKSQSMQILPIPPKPFLERELVMHRILKAFFVDRRQVRLVRIHGPKGSGKVSLAKAIAQYVKKRAMWGQILWLPPLHRDLEFVSPNSMFHAILEDYRQHEKAILIVDTQKFSHESIHALNEFLDRAFEQTKYLKVIVIEDTTGTNNAKIQSTRHATGFECYQDTVELAPLSFDAAAFLFCHACGHKGSGYGAMKKLLRLRDDPIAWTVLGEGNPAKIVILAKEITQPEFQTLIHGKGTTLALDDFTTSLSRVRQIMAADEAPKQQQQQPPHYDSRQVDLKKLVVKDLIKGPKPIPLRTQEEIIHRFLPIFHLEKRVHRKKVPSFIRKASKGEHVVTIINGVVATEKTVEDDSSWIVCGQVANEYYPLTDEKFRAIYDTEHPEPISHTNPQHLFLRENGFQQYRSKRKVYAHEVDESDMHFFRQDSTPTTTTTKEAYFMAPWGSPNRIELGDYLVLQYPDGKDDIYRIERTLFKGSYADVRRTSMQQQADNLRERTTVLEHRMAEYLEQNPGFAPLEGDIRNHLQALMAALNQRQNTASSSSLSLSSP
ncbi:expressed unknown protein [Seminavis robusta]|uniref:CHAT domain-containing protein n=1 Tax=Seminavis robusta TaxID=568900 RepID=A0A9N8E4U4_9STRA|nr:expressed unknown protein [Seminavis robusta]|eukprot:Sro660_g183030.1 n/a (848) ;mRNA; r:31826-34488